MRDLSVSDLSAYQRKRRFALGVGLVILSLFFMSVQSAWTPLFARSFISNSGIILILIGVLGRVWCTLYIGGRKTHEVVRHGPYSVMRNPLYFFSSIASMGVGAQSGSLIIALLLGVLCVVAFLIVIKREEGFLAHNFGQEYKDYCASVPRFFPTPRLYQDLECLSINPKHLYRTFFDGLVFFSAVPLFGLVYYAQHRGWVPVYFYFY
jgi:protein-S-isoprenylcysteine O-methyltransferase Ste14